MALPVKSLISVALLTLLFSVTHGQLNPNFYSSTCPDLQRIVLSTMKKAIQKEPRMGASILRLFFHDCFVNGCDASVLLDDTPPIKSEKSALPNMNSLRGFEVIDAIKTSVEKSCKRTVSCADILALAARDSVVLLGGPNWPVNLGRRDAQQPAAFVDLPSPFASLPDLISRFKAKGLSSQDMTALSGAHTLGQARCSTFRSRVYGNRNIDGSFAALRQRTCPPYGGDNNLAPLDIRTPNRFDNGFYKNLVIKQGLLQSDQELYNGGSQDTLVKKYSVDPVAFANDFAAAMAKMGDISPLTGSRGEIRLNCHKKN